jgi:hypothetical protein
MTMPHSPAGRLRFDSNRAWTQATAAIRANREVVFALAGVFFLLPSLALALLFPQPEPAAGADEAAMMAQAAAYYSKALPVALPMAVLQAAGTLGLLTLLTDRARPTVGQAIRAGFGALLPYIASQVILGMALGMLFLIGGGVLGAARVPALTLIGGIAMAAILAVIVTRFALTAPVVAIDKWRNPLAALRRAWQLTAGNTGRVLVFFALILLAFAIVMMVVTGLSGIVLALLLPAKFAALAAAVISSTLGAGMVLVLVACLAATHAQLAGDPAEGVGAAFE